MPAGSSRSSRLLANRIRLRYTAGRYSPAEDAVEGASLLVSKTTALTSEK